MRHSGRSSTRPRASTSAACASMRTPMTSPRSPRVAPAAARPRIDDSMIVRLSKSFHFEAAHDLPTFPPNHKCRRLHGHSFRFDVVVEGEVDKARGYLI